MSDITENTTENPTDSVEVIPTIWTFLKAFWSASWRVQIFVIPFILPFLEESSVERLFEMKMSNPVFYYSYFLIIGTICLFFAMKQLNRLIYSQGMDLVALRINNNSIFFYLIVVSAINIVFFILPNIFIFVSPMNEWIETLLDVIPKLFIFHRMMTKGIMGHKIITRKIP